MSHTRYDTIDGLAPAKRTDAGGFVAQGYVTRVGILTYRNADGTTRRELRPEEEVFRQDSFQALNMLPVTLMHPPEGLLDPKTTKARTIGSAASATKVGDFIRMDIAIHDAEGIAAAEAGVQGLSLGYRVDIDETPGTWRGKPYDAVQRNIVPNHIAVVPSGRAGPEAKIRLDGESESCDSGQVPTAEVVPEVPVADAVVLKVVKLDGADVEVPAAVAPVIEKLSARLDAALEDLAKAKEAASDAVVDARARARGTLLAKASEILGTDARLDGSDSDVKKLVIAKVKPTWALEGSAEYINARYDAAVDAFQEAKASHQGASTRTDAAIDANKPAVRKRDAAYEKMIAERAGPARDANGSK